MARGWESKSVESQQELATSEAGRARSRLTPGEIAAKQRRRALQLSRQRVLQQMEVATNPRHREMLEAALAELEKEIEKQ